MKIANYEYVEYLNDDIQSVEVKRWKGKHLFCDTYYFYNGVPLRDGKDALFQDIRALTRYICFDSWNQLMIFMLRGLKLKIPIEQEPEPEVIDTS